MHAYDKLYLEKAQIALGSMLDYAVYDLQYEAERFWELFIASGYADRFGNGDCALTVGKSGVELARMTIETASGRPQSGVLGRLGAGLLSVVLRSLFQGNTGCCSC